MTIRPLAPTNTPALREKAQKVRDFGPALQSLIEDMVETMKDAPGLGLAAPQIGVSLRLAVIELPEGEEEDGQERNPEVVKTWGEEEGQEGCLSVPTYVGDVKRAAKVLVKAQDRHGKKIRLRAEGLMARVLQHEIDHLNGTLFVDHVESLDKLYRIEPSDEDAIDEDKPII